MLNPKQIDIVRELRERGIGDRQVFNPWDVFPDAVAYGPNFPYRQALEELRRAGLIRVDFRLGGLAYYLTGEAAVLCQERGDTGEIDTGGNNEEGRPIVLNCPSCNDMNKPSPYLPDF